MIQNSCAHPIMKNLTTLAMILAMILENSCAHPIHAGGAIGRNTFHYFVFRRGCLWVGTGNSLNRGSWNGILLTVIQSEL
jgi:hypothetical protein